MFGRVLWFSSVVQNGLVSTSALHGLVGKSDGHSALVVLGGLTPRKGHCQCRVCLTLYLLVFHPKHCEISLVGWAFNHHVPSVDSIHLAK